MRMIFMTSLLVGGLVACSNDHVDSALNADKPSEASEITEPEGEVFHADEIFTCTSEQSSESYKFEISYDRLDKTRLSVKGPLDDEYRLVDKKAMTELRSGGFGGPVRGLDVQARSTPDFSEQCYNVVTSYRFGLQSAIGGLGNAQGSVRVHRYIDVDSSVVCNAPIARPSIIEHELVCQSLENPSN